MRFARLAELFTSFCWSPAVKHPLHASMTSPIQPVVVQLPRLYRDDDELLQYAMKMKEIRLKGLANDPGSFASSLALEIDKPTEFWTGRLKHPEARHFVVCLPDEHDPAVGSKFDPLRST
jgi:hypothetical protein